MVKEAFPIIHPKIRLEIKLEKVENVYIHEEVMPSTLRKLMEDLRADDLFKHPVIVDSKTLVVLDGMHRVAATKNLGYRFIPVCLVEYENPHIKVGCWFRVIDHSSNFQKLVKSIRETGFVVEKCQREIARKLVDEREAIAAIMASSKCFVVRGPQENIVEIYEAIKQIEGKLRSQGYSINYDAESDAQEKVLSEENLSMLMVPTVSKKDVVEIALRGEVLAHKTTRHVIPVRPLFVNVPLEWLRGVLTLEKANEILVEHLTKKRITHLPPGRIIDRRYEEELYIFK